MQKPWPEAKEDIVALENKVEELVSKGLLRIELEALNAELLAALKEVYAIRSQVLNFTTKNKEIYGSISHCAAKFELVRKAIAKAEGRE